MIVDLLKYEINVAIVPNENIKIIGISHLIVRGFIYIGFFVNPAL